MNLDSNSESDFLVHLSSPDQPLMIDLFSGVGGLSLGLEAAGFGGLCKVELEEIAGRYCEFNFPGAHVFRGKQGDIRDFSGDRVRSLLPEEAAEIALVAGGPPCQGYSIAGKKNADDPLNLLVLEFARVVLELSPLAFLMENVPGITSGNAPFLRQAIESLSAEYRVHDPTLLSAADFGVPQIRERVFILGIRKDVGALPSLPTATHRRPSASTSLFDEIPATPTSWEAISDLPNVDEYQELIDGDRVPYEVPPSNPYQTLMRSSPFGLASERIDWDRSICTNLRRTLHGPVLLERLAGLKVGQIDAVSGIRRLNPSEPSTTIRAGTTKDRGAWSAPRPLHPFYDRVLTTRECARIQSFPDWFLFHPVKWHGNRQVGNAVPPLLAKAIGEHILGLLRLQTSKRQGPISRDFNLVEDDVVAASQSGLSRRKTSHQVTNTKKR